MQGLGPWSLFSSLELDADVVENGGTFSADGVFAGVSALSLQVPTLWLSSFSFSASSKASLQAQLAAAILQLTLGFETDVNASAAFVGHAFLDLLEVDENDNVLSGRSFRGSVLNPWKLTTENFDDSTGIGSVQLFRAEGAFNVTIIGVVSNEAGLLSTGAVVTPKSVEVIVQINMYPYADPANPGSVVLRMAVGSASAFFTASGKMVLDGQVVNDMTERVGSGAADSGTWCDFAKIANVAVEANSDPLASQSVKVSVEAAGNLTVMGPQLQAMLQGKVGAGGEGHVNIISVKFPRGAKYIVYDPTIGTGPAPFSDTDNAGLSAGAIAAIVLVSIAIPIGLGFAVWRYTSCCKEKTEAERVHLLPTTAKA